VTAVRVESYDGYRRQRPAGAGSGDRRPAARRGRAPLYARMLRLRAIRPGGLLCFLFFEGTVALGALLALAELASWWAPVVLPGTVAAMVKINDLIAALGNGGAVRARTAPVRASAPVPAPPVPVARGRAPVPQVRRRLPGTNQRRFERPYT
jgi:hypothetical protein